MADFGNYLTPGGSMKIEPELYRFRNSEQVIEAMPGYTPPSADWGKLYTEAQMRQLGEACAALVETAIELKDVCNRPSAARTRAEAWRKLDKAIAKALQPNV